MILNKETEIMFRHLKEYAYCIPVRIKREKYEAICISEMTAIELLDVLIMWSKQKRQI